MKKSLLFLFTFLTILSCSEDDSYGGGDDGIPNPDPIPEEAKAVQLQSDATFGDILTNSDGFTLYFFAPDSKGTSNCIDGCITNWPVFFNDDLTLDSGLNAADFGTITREDGAQQNTFKGWPLYTFANDAAANEVNGDGAGDVWFVAKPDYSIMVTKAQLVGRDSDGIESNLDSSFAPGDEETTYITDANGTTLYSFIIDRNGQNNFTAPDFSNDAVWPIFGETAVNIPSILNAADFTTIDVFGQAQLTFKGWPLYYFGQDAVRGDNYGVGFPVAGIWPTVNNDTEVAPAPDPNALRIANDATFGDVMTNVDGFTLYFFAPDSKGTSNCAGGCLNSWPVFYAEDLTLDSGLDAADFGTITRADGAMQNTFKGWPLYTFANDAAANDINGDGAGDVWFVAKPDYSIMVAKAQLVGRDSNGVETNLDSTFAPGDEATTYITDAEGNTLYSFINDTNGKNNFTASDFSNDAVWPIFGETAANIPSILDAADFATIAVFGETQLTFKGWPLYYFGQDAARGDNYGVGFPVAGIWPTVNNDTEVAPEAPVSNKSYDVTNQGASAYIFNGEGLTDASNTDITLKRGVTYEFNISTPGHPFLINSVQGVGTGNMFNDGVTNNGVSSGTVTFTVPNNAPDTLFYNCEFHGSMTGTFNIID